MTVPTIDGSRLAEWATRLVRPDERVLFGIAGPPGAGKSTVASSLADLFGAPIVGLDGFHLALGVVEERGWVDVKGAPHTFDPGGFVALLERLAAPGADETIYAPRYDRAARNAIGSAVPIEPHHGFVIVEGNYLLLDEAPWQRVASILTVCVYLDLDDEIRVHRLVERHVAYGKTPDAPRDFVTRSDEANARLVKTTRHRADAVVKMS